MRGGWGSCVPRQTAIAFDEAMCACARSCCRWQNLKRFCIQRFWFVDFKAAVVSEAADDVDLVVSEVCSPPVSTKKGHHDERTARTRSHDASSRQQALGFRRFLPT